jgi:hypothetical protein
MAGTRFKGGKYHLRAVIQQIPCRQTAKTGGWKGCPGVARLSGNDNIFCMESPWNPRLEGHRQTVRPLLELLRATNGHRFIHLTCSTRAEFEFNLRQHRRYRSYGLIYLAFHGEKGRLLLADGSSITVGELAATMAGRLGGSLVHFGSCLTVLDEYELSYFLEVTGAAVATGYRKNVDWIDSAAMDLLLLDWAGSYQNSKSLVDKMFHAYNGLVEATGFCAVLR